MKYILSLVLVVFAVCFDTGKAFDWDEVTPLDEYVWREEEDDPYGYELFDTFVEDGYTMYSINLTSQRWMDDSVVVEEDTIWRHWMTIVVPDNLVINNAALLHIYGGNKNSDPPTPDDGTVQRFIKFALDTGSVAAGVNNIPHQPTTFADDRIPRTEDQIIARTWRYFIEGIVNDTDVILQLPMARAARRAVDTVVDFTNQVNPDINIDSIMPSGFSKRGWTAWLLGCVDQRVFSMVPVVLDILNWHPNLHHHYQAYGGWSWAFQPYWVEDVSRYINHSRAAIMGEEVAVDPFVYDVRLAPRPKLIVSATGDEFFLPDDSHYYFQDLQGQYNYLQIMENTNHGLGGQTDRLWRNMANFFLTSYQMSWVREDDVDTGVGSLTLTIESGTVKSVTGWTADTTNYTVEIDDDGNEVHRRDFRMRTLRYDNPIEWIQTEVIQDGSTYSLEFEHRDAGYRGFFIEVTVAGLNPDDEATDINITTEIQIVPDSLPWDKCATEQECRGILK